MTWLVQDPSFGLAAGPDWELPEEDEVLAPLATLGATRVGSLAPPPSSAPPVVARSLTVGPSLSGPPPSIDGRPPLLTPVKDSQGSSVGGKTVFPSSPVAPMKLLSEVGGELEVMGLEETGAPMDVDAGTPEPVGAKGPRAKRRRVEEDEAEDEDEDEEDDDEDENGMDFTYCAGMSRLTFLPSRWMEGPYSETTLGALEMRKTRMKMMRMKRYAARTASE